MQSWSVTPTASIRALSGLISDLARPGFCRAALAHVNEALPVDSWAVYRLWTGRPPQLHLSASRFDADCTTRCFAAYRDTRLYVADHSFDAVRAGTPTGVSVLLRMHANDMSNHAHRDAIYRRHGIRERLSVARIERDGSVLAVNLYRHEPAARFDADHVAAFGALAPGLMAAVARHVDWLPAPVPPSHRTQLQAHCPGLTDRELDVLERLLQGMTYDGIAEDLDLSVCTVKTYRARAFGRLDIHFRNQLFARFLHLQ
jgi:DNA-binding CsgD family transcriptional regulator